MSDARRIGQRIATEIAADPSAKRGLPGSLSFGDASAIVAFASLPGEVETTPILEWALNAGIPLLLPRMRGDALDFARVEHLDRLVAGRFGVREPGPASGTQRVPAGAVVFVPGLAFDRMGGRLGRGAGYYDRALAALRSESRETLFLGLAGALQIVAQVPMEANDVFLDGVLTEEEWIWAADAPDPAENGAK